MLFLHECVLGTRPHTQCRFGKYLSTSERRTYAIGRRVDKSSGAALQQGCAHCSRSRHCRVQMSPPGGGGGRQVCRPKSVGGRASDPHSTPRALPWSVTVRVVKRECSSGKNASDSNTRPRRRHAAGCRADVALGAVLRVRIERGKIEFHPVTLSARLACPV